MTQPAPRRHSIPLVSQLSLSSQVSLALLLIVASAFAGCGFHPRGSVDTLTDPGSIFVDAGREITLAPDLRDAFADQSFRTAATRDEADVLLRLTGERESRRIVSVQSTGRVSEFELSHSVNMQIAESVGGQPPRYDPDQSPNRVEVIREYTYDERGVLGKEEEARILRAEMRGELIRQVVLRTVASLASQRSGADGTSVPIEVRGGDGEVSVPGDSQPEESPLNDLPPVEVPGSVNETRAGRSRTVQ